jgi:futalosine hydrolase
VILLACAVAAETAFCSDLSDVERLVTGVGPVEAACVVTAALASRSYRLVVNAGIGGAFEGCAPVGAGAVVSDDAMELDLESGAPLALPPGIELVDRVNSDPTLVARVAAAGFPVLRGITVARVTSSEATARRLAHERGAQVESMEGFAVLRAASLAGVPAIQLRGISNRCGDRERSGWDFRAGVEGLRAIVNAFFELPGVRTESRR